VRRGDKRGRADVLRAWRRLAPDPDPSQPDRDQRPA